jgi:uncharacterized protein (DUF885 family)
MTARSIFFMVILSFGLAACERGQPPGEIEATNPQSIALHALFDDEFEARIANNPLMASEMGRGQDDIMPNATAEEHARITAQDQEFLGRLRAIERAALGEEDQLNYDLFEFVMFNRVENAKYRSYRIPLLSDYGFHNNFLNMYQGVDFDNVEAYRNYIARLNDVPRYFNENMTNMRTGIAEGFTMPREIMDNIVPSITGLIVENPEDSPFFTPFLTLSDNLTESEKAEIEAAGRDAIMNSVVPAYQEFYEFFTGEYATSGRPTISISDTPGGEEYYRYLTRYYTTIDITPEQVHEIGLREVARIKGEMEDIIEEVGFEGTFAEFLEFMRTDPQFYVTEPVQLLKEASWIAKRIDAKLPGFFGTLPRMPYGVRDVPASMASNYTTGRYWGPNEAAGLGGFFVVNTYALDKRPLYTLAALALHEGVPGHHLQNSLNAEQEGVPEFRQRFYPHAYGEGWGLYSEKLGVEMGIYQTPYEHFGRLSYEMWRAGRLVVDTGMHIMGWTREEAVNLFVENSALSLHNINTEVDRYIAWPGQALAYKMGELTLWRLRHRAEDALGDDFDIREFHDAVMAEGALPMSILEAQIESYITDKRSAIAAAAATEGAEE